MRRQYLTTDKPCVEVELASGHQVLVRLVDSYVHLGHVVGFSGSCLADIQARLHSANLVFRRLKNTLLRNKALSVAERTYLVRTLVHSKLGYGAGLWVPQHKAEKEAFQHAFMTHWRQSCRLLCGVGSKLLSDGEVCAILGVAEPHIVGQAAVLRQLKAVLAHGHGFLWEAIEAEGAWLLQAVHALQNAIRLLEVRQSPPDNHAGMADLMPYASFLSTWARRLTAKAAKDNAVQAEVSMQKAVAISSFGNQGGLRIPVPAQEIQPLWTCQICGRSCRTKSALAVHKSILHGERASSFSAAGTACAVCGTHWWTTARLRQHVWRSSICSQAYAHADLNEPRSFEVVGSRRDLAWRPPIPAHGPREWWTTLRPLGNPPEAAAAPVRDEGCRSLIQRLGEGCFEVWAKAAVEWVCRTSDCKDLIEDFPAHEWSQILPGICQLKERSFVSDCIEVSDWLISGDGRHLWLMPAQTRSNGA